MENAILFTILAGLVMFILMIVIVVQLGNQNAHLKEIKKLLSK